MNKDKIIEKNTENNSGISSENYRRTPYKVLVLLAYFVIITALVAVFTLSKYTSQTGGSSVTNIATFVASYSASTENIDTETIDLTGMTPGEERKIELRISNTAEVSISYVITASSYGNLPLVLTFENSSNQNTGSSLSGEILLGGEDDIGYLYVKWDNNEISDYYASEIDALTITMHYEQTD